MGGTAWNSSMQYQGSPYRETADQMVTTGMKDADTRRHH